MLFLEFDWDYIGNRTAYVTLDKFTCPQAVWGMVHLSMFTLDRPTCVRNRLSAFQVGHGLSAPAGRCSSAFTCVQNHDVSKCHDSNIK